MARNQGREIRFAGGWLLKGNRALYDRYNFFLYSLSFFQYMPGRCYRSADKMTVHEYRGQKRGMRDRSLRFSPFEGAAVNLVVQAPRTPRYVLVRTTVCWQCKRGPKALSIAAGVAMTPWNLHPASKSFSPLFSLTSLSSLSSVLAARCTHSRGQLQSLASNLLESLVKQTNRFHSRGRATRAPYLLGRHAFSRPFSRFRFMPVHPGFFYSGKFVSSSCTGDDDRVERIAISTRLF